MILFTFGGFLVCGDCAIKLCANGLSVVENFWIAWISGCRPARGVGVPSEVPLAEIVGMYLRDTYGHPPLGDRSQE